MIEDPNLSAVGKAVAEIWFTILVWAVFVLFVVYLFMKLVPDVIEELKEEFRGLRR